MANLRVDKITSTETFETTGSVQFGSGKTMKLSANSGFDLTDNDFTIECWMCMHRVESFQQLILYTVDGTEDDTVWQFDITSTQLRFVAYVSNSSEVYGTNFSFEPGTWYHIAATRTNDLIRLFVDGDLIGTHPFSATIDTEASAEINIGFRNNQGTADRFVNGHLSNIRIIKGAALYTADFKPPMKELEVVPGTVLLCCQSKTDPSLEKTGKTITITGNLPASELTPGLLTPIPKDGGSSAIKGSVEFDGTGDYLKITEENDFDLGADDFTIEYWYNEGNDDRSERRTLYMRDSAQQWLVGHTNDNSGRIFFQAFDSSGNTISGGAVTSTNASNPTGKRNHWRHLAVVRNGTTATIYLDGVASGSRSFGTTAIRGDQNDLYIGQDPASSGREFRGFISNLRIVKGTALYTDDFIPPTRELKKVPGTVLLCCQDPDSPLTEATGKTITGYGDLYELDENVDLSTTASWVDGSTGAGSASESNGALTMQGNDASNRGIISKTVTEGIRPGVTYQMSFEIFDAATNGKLGLDSNDGTNDVLDDPTATIDMVHFSGSDLDGNTGIFTVEGTATTHQVVMYFQEFGAAGTTEFKVRNITLRAVNADSTNINKASNFTPQVGDDRKVTLEGNTKVSTENYFYLPTGDTYTRDSRYGRGLFMGGYTSTGNVAVEDIHYINIPSMGNSRDFGDLVNAARWAGGSCGSSTRGLYGGGATPTSTDHIDYVTIATTSDALDFGNLATAQGYVKACSNQTRGIWGGGRSSTSPTVSSDVIQYITIASTGAAIDFGNLTSARTALSETASPTRAVFSGGYTSPSTTAVDVIDYVTIASTGNAVDFGNLLVDVRYSDVASNGIRGVIGGGSAPVTNAIQYITIPSKGDALDFGDLTNSLEHISCTDNSIRGVFGGGVTPTYLNVMQYITIATTGDAQDFGDLSRTNLGYAGGTSDSHGGLG